MKNTGTLKISTPTDREIVMTRVFDAPRRLVFDAFSKPELLKRWFGPRGWSLVVCDVDLRVGGSFRFVLRGPDGRDMGMRGVYREIVPPERSVHVESFDDYPGEAVVTAVFVEEAGKTTMTATVEYASREIRDAVIKSGMEHGAAESYDKLAELLASPKGTSVRKITPFLWFDTQAEEAMNHYVSIFKNSRPLSVNRANGKVMTVTFELEGQEFIGLNAGPQYKFTEAISFFVTCETQEEVDELWEKLSAGGEKGRCGWLKDKFGLSWQVIPTALRKLMNDPDPGKSNAVVQAMLKMNKIVIEDLQKAYARV